MRSKPRLVNARAVGDEEGSMEELRSGRKNGGRPMLWLPTVLVCSPGPCGGRDSLFSHGMSVCAYALPDSYQAVVSAGVSSGFN